MRRHRTGCALADARGMTMIEVMVSVSILAVMGFLVYGGIFISIRSQERAQTMHERYHSARVFLGRIKSELSMAFISLHQSDEKDTVTLFEGERDRVVFNTSAHSPIRRNAHQSDQLEVEYYIGRDDDGDRALLRRVKFHVDDRGGKGGHEEVVLSGVRDFELEYFDKEREDWTDDWEVVIEDANEKRELLKIVRDARDVAEDLRGDDGTGNVDMGKALSDVGKAGAIDKLADDAESEVLEQLFLPSRVKVRLVLEDEEDREYEFETQTEIRVTNPLWY